MSRAAWFVAGAAAGAYGLLRGRRAAESLTPDGLRDRASGLSLGAQLFAQEVRTGMTEKEAELRGRLHLVTAADGVPELERGDTPPPAREPAHLDQKDT
jgi:hypothetical protein